MNTMNNMNRCIGTQSKMIYNCQNFRFIDPQAQIQNPHQLPTQQITKINTTANKSDQPQPNKDASDNQNLSFSQQQSQDQQPTQPSTTYIPEQRGDKDLTKMLGVSPSDIDKYSRVVFPVCYSVFCIEKKNFFFLMIMMMIELKFNLFLGLLCMF